MFERKKREAEQEKKRRQEPNDTGIPAQLKKSLERNTGYSFDDVRVHYYSEKPAKLEALAYTQGSQVYLGPGQERHLPHELGHVVQQKMGIVHANTRHESGAALNTDAALERQADEIGNGRVHLQGSPSAADTDTVQRMSVFEGAEGGSAKVARYKKKGWIAAQALKKYFTEESLNEITYEEMREYAGILQTFMDGEAPGKDFVTVFPNLYPKLDFCGEIIPAQWATLPRKIFGLINAVLEQEESGRASEPEEAADERKFTDTGKYERTEEINPYTNFKKRGMHYLAVEIERQLSRENKTAGPHIAVSIFGGRIFLAKNSKFEEYNRRTPVSPDELKQAAVSVLKRMKGQAAAWRIGDIQRIEGSFGDAAGKAAIDPKEADQIFDWIQKISGYEIAVIDVPDTAANPGNGPVHGEMIILDYLIREQGKHSLQIPGMPETVSQILSERNEKLRELGAPDSTGTKRRVIRFGGTKIDCAKCHEFFAENAEMLSGNRIISSDNAGPVYGGTQKGTWLKEPGSAYVTVSDLHLRTEEVKAELAKLKGKLAELAAAKAANAEKSPGAADSAAAADLPALTGEEAALIREIEIYCSDFAPGELIAESVELSEIRNLMDEILRVFQEVRI